MESINKLIDSTKELLEILSKLREMGKKDEEITELLNRRITLTNLEKYYPFQKNYQGFKVEVQKYHFHITIDSEDMEEVCIDGGKTSLGDLYTLMKYKDKIIPVLKEDLAKKDAKLDEMIDELKRAIAALELAGFKVQ